MAYYNGTILNSPFDYDSVRAIIGTDTQGLSDNRIETIGFVKIVEVIVSKRVASQSANGVPSVANIMAVPQVSPATPDDRTIVKAIALNIIGKLFAPGSTNAINVSISTEDQTADLGGIGEQWIEMANRFANEAAYYFSLLTNWVEVTPDVMIMGGPVSTGNQPDTVSGFPGPFSVV